MVVCYLESVLLVSTETQILEVITQGLRIQDASLGQGRPTAFCLETIKKNVTM